MQISVQPDAVLAAGGARSGGLLRVGAVGGEFAGRNLRWRQGGPGRRECRSRTVVHAARSLATHNHLCRQIGVRLSQIHFQFSFGIHGNESFPSSIGRSQPRLRPSPGPLRGIHGYPPMPVGGRRDRFVSWTHAWEVWQERLGQWVKVRKAREFFSPFFFNGLHCGKLPGRGAAPGLRGGWAPQKQAKPLATPNWSSGWGALEATKAARRGQRRVR